MRGVAITVPGWSVRGVAKYSARVVSGGCGYIQCQDGQWGVWLYTVLGWSVGGVAIYSARMVSGGVATYSARMVSGGRGYIQCQNARIIQ